MGQDGLGFAAETINHIVAYGNKGCFSVCYMNIRVTWGSAHCRGTQTDGSFVVTNASVITVEGEEGVGKASPFFVDLLLVLLTHF